MVAVESNRQVDNKRLTAAGAVIFLWVCPSKAHNRVHNVRSRVHNVRNRVHNVQNWGALRRYCRTADIFAILDRLPRHCGWG